MPWYRRRPWPPPDTRCHDLSAGLGCSNKERTRDTKPRPHGRGLFFRSKQARLMTLVPTEKFIREDIRSRRLNRVTLSLHGRDPQDGAKHTALAVPVALATPGGDPRPSTSAHRLAPHGSEARPPQSAGSVAVRAALSALSCRLGFDRHRPTGHDRALAPTWLQSLMAVEVAAPSGQARHSQRCAGPDPPDQPRQSAVGSTPRSWRAAQTRGRCFSIDSGKVHVEG